MPQENITAQRNFETLGNAMLLLFQCLTGDNWSGLMSDATVKEASGLCKDSAGNCGSSAAIPYFIGFQLLGSFVFLNLVVAVILENFSSLGNVRTDLVSASDLENFKESWSVYDPDGDSKIPMLCLPDLIMNVPPPMGLMGANVGPGGGPPLAKRHNAVKLCMRLQCRNPKGFMMPLRQEKGEVYFADVCDALVQQSYKRQGVGLDDAVSAIEEIPPPEISAVAFSPDPKGRQAARTSMYELDDDFAHRMKFDIDKIFALEIINGHKEKLDGWAKRAMNRLTERREGQAREAIQATSPASQEFKKWRKQESFKAQVGGLPMAPPPMAPSSFHVQQPQSVPTGGASSRPSSARGPPRATEFVRRNSKGSLVANAPAPAAVDAKGRAVRASNSFACGTGSRGKPGAADAGGGAGAPPAAAGGRSARGEIKQAGSGAGSKQQLLPPPSPLPPPGTGTGGGQQQQGQQRAPPVMGGSFGPNAVAATERRRASGGTPLPPPPVSVPSTLRGRSSSPGRPFPLQSPGSVGGVSSTSPEATAAAEQLRMEFRSMRQQHQQTIGGSGARTPTSTNGLSPGINGGTLGQSPLCNGTNPSGNGAGMNSGRFNGTGTPNVSARGISNLSGLSVQPPSPGPQASLDALDQFRALRGAQQTRSRPSSNASGDSAPGRSA